MPVYIRDSLIRNDIETLLKLENVAAVATNYYENKDIMKVKRMLKDSGIETTVTDCGISFGELKKSEAGLVPVIVQDYKTSQVLMLAYMNAERFQATVDTANVYYSRAETNNGKGLTSDITVSERALLDWTPIRCG